MPLLTAGMPRKQARAKARAALEQLRLGHRLRNLPRTYPAGRSNAWPSPGPWPTTPG